MAKKWKAMQAKSPKEQQTSLENNSIIDLDLISVQEIKEAAVQEADHFSIKSSEEENELINPIQSSFLSQADEEEWSSQNGKENVIVIKLNSGKAQREEIKEETTNTDRDNRPRRPFRKQRVMLESDAVQNTFGYPIQRENVEYLEPFQIYTQNYPRIVNKMQAALQDLRILEEEQLEKTAREKDLQALNKKEYQIEQYFEEHKKHLSKIGQRRIINFKRFKDQNQHNQERIQKFRKYLLQSQVLSHQKRQIQSERSLEKAVLYHLIQQYKDGSLADVYLTSVDFALSYPTAYLQSLKMVSQMMKRKKRVEELSDSEDELIVF